MNEWTPPQSVEFRAPTDGRVVRNLFEAQARRIAALEGAAPLRQAGVRGRPGLLASLDFDGDGTHTDLGTAGWMLGGDPAFLALHGVDVYASLAARDETILGLIADLATAQETLADQVAAIDALVGAQVSPVGFSTEGTGWSNPAGAGYVRASITLTAPTGFTQGLVTANMYVQAVHTGDADYLRVYPEISAAQGRPGGTYVNPGAGDQTNISYTRLVVATSIVVNAIVLSTWAVPADAANIANITGSVLWLR